MKKTLFIALLMMISAMLFAGPFGMEFGWTLEELEASGVYTWEPTRQGSVTSYWASPIKPHSQLSLYIVFIDDEYGLFDIRSVADASYSESQVRTLYNTLKAQLSSVYGEPEEYDEIDWLSDLTGSGNFIKSIFHGDRILNSTWYLDSTDDNETSMVVLGVLTPDEYTAFVGVEYYSHACEKVFTKYNEAEASVL